MTYIQYGCGFVAPEGWLNFDASPTLRLQRMPVIGPLFARPRFPKNVRYGDICSGLPVAEASADVVYCCHILEHLALDEARLAIKNTFKILRPGGAFRLVVPDLRRIVDQYLASTQPDAAVNFVHHLMLGCETRPHGFKAFVRSWFGHEHHLWMWDYQSLAAELQAAGFTSIRRAIIGDHPDPMLAKIEQKERWDNEVGIHSVRPC